MTRITWALLGCLSASGCYLTHGLSPDPDPALPAGAEPTVPPAAPACTDAPFWSITLAGATSRAIATNGIGDVLVAGEDWEAGRGFLTEIAADGVERWTIETAAPVQAIGVGPEGEVAAIDGNGAVTLYEADLAARWSRPASDDDGASTGTGAALDGEGRVIVTGVHLRPSDLSWATGDRIWVEKRDTWSTPMWSHEWRGPGDDRDDDWVVGVATDPDDAVVIAGHGYEGDQPSSVWARKLDADGEVAWTHVFEGVGAASDVETDSTGAVIVTGSLYEGGTWSLFTWKLDGDGNELWAVREEDGGGVSLAIGPDDGIVTAAFVENDGHYRYMLRALDPAGSLLRTAAVDEMAHPAVDPCGVVVTAHSRLSPDVTTVRRLRM